MDLRRDLDPLLHLLRDRLRLDDLTAPPTTPPSTPSARALQGPTRAQQGPTRGTLAGDTARTASLESGDRSPLGDWGAQVEGGALRGMVSEGQGRVPARDKDVQGGRDKELGPGMEQMAERMCWADSVLGSIVERAPGLLRVHPEDIAVRIEYFLSKRFVQADVRRMVLQTPAVLTHLVRQVDAQLGALQREFALTGIHASAMYPLCRD